MFIRNLPPLWQVHVRSSYSSRGYNDRVIQSINPATEQVERTFSSLDEAGLDDRIRRSQKAFDRFRRTSFEERKQWLLKAATLLEGDADRFAKTITVEMGKPIKAAKAEILK